MRTHIHKTFICDPIFRILQDCIFSTKTSGAGIQTYPLCDYVMQTTFLKMTGASEQKMKCILWELATYDFEFRYKYLGEKNYGEMSRLDDKKKVFKCLIEQIKKISSKRDTVKNLFNDSIKGDIINRATVQIYNLFVGTNVARWQERGMLFFQKKCGAFIDKEWFCKYDKKNDKETVSLLEEKINYKDIVFNHRNRCAHNLRSYQINLPDLDGLLDEGYDYQNYFFRFSILVLLDEIFIHAYQKYLELLEYRCFG